LCDRRLRDQATQRITSWQDLTIENVADHENLLRTFNAIKHRAGPSPGPDGVAFRDLGPREAAAYCRELSILLREGTCLYQPHPSRRVRIPKQSGNGYRQLAIRNIFDRVVSATLNRMIGPLWEQIFLPSSHGFRPGRGPWSCLAELKTVMERENRWVLALDDIRSAFDSVKIEDVVKDHAQFVTDEKVQLLIESVLRGSSNQNRILGIEQGDPYSPTALNVRLHYAHDLPLSRQRRTPPWLRYVDNLVYPCQSVPEGTQMLNRSRKLLARAGLALKGDDGPPTDLRTGRSARLLGFQLGYDAGTLCLSLGDDAWRGLEQCLLEAHKDNNPPEAARLAVHGWLSAFAPAFVRTETTAITNRVLTIAAKYGFHELTTRDHLQQRVGHLHRCWCARLTAAHSHRTKTVRGTVVRGGRSAHPAIRAQTL
jgi:hypothetical protein